MTHHAHLPPAVVTVTDADHIVQYAADQRGILKRVWRRDDNVEVTLWLHIPRHPCYRGTVSCTATGWQAHDAHGTCIGAGADSYRAAETMLLRLLAAEHGAPVDAATFDEPLSTAERAVIAGLRQTPQRRQPDEAENTESYNTANPRRVDPDRYHDRMAANAAYAQTLDTQALCDTWQQLTGLPVPDQRRSRNRMARESIIDELVTRHPEADQACQDAMSRTHDRDMAVKALVDAARAAA